MGKDCIKFALILSPLRAKQVGEFIKNGLISLPPFIGLGQIFFVCFHLAKKACLNKHFLNEGRMGRGQGPKKQGFVKLFQDEIET